MSKQSSGQPTIVVKGLQKSYGKLKVLQGVDFSVQPGMILALLGPNGAGKTTTIKILSTLLLPDGGSAKIVGYDVVKQPNQVKSSIGLTGQYAAVDEYLTGYENLEMIGRLYRLSQADCRARAAELMEKFDLVDAGKRPVKTYSGGMRRRLDLAMSLIANPPIIFLDEPTTGLDPRSRATMWQMIRDLANSGTSILLTTQYMDEADYLADNIIVIDGGKVIAEGDSKKLKSMVGSDRLEIVVDSSSNLDKAVTIAKDGDNIEVDTERRAISIAGKGGTAKFRALLARLEDNGVKIESFSLRRPTLDDVFMTLTGHTATSETAENPKQKGSK